MSIQVPENVTHEELTRLIIDGIGESNGDPIKVIWMRHPMDKERIERHQMICELCKKEIEEKDLLQMDPEIWGVHNVHQQCWVAIWTRPELREES